MMRARARSRARRSTPAASASEDVAILKDLIGVAQMLAIPTRKITGIEDPQMLAPDAPPVFADGWKAKTLVEARLGGRTLPREAVALAINSQYARSQEQLHVHVDCVPPRRHEGAGRLSPLRSTTNGGR